VLPSAAGQSANNLPAIVEQSDPVEGVHQMRVGLRRMRAALSVFKPHLAESDRAMLRDLLRPYLDALGPARDLDVFLTETLPPALAAFAGDPAIAAFLVQATATRDRGRKALCALLAAPEHSRAWLTVGRWLAGGPVEDGEPVVHFAGKVLAKRARKVKRAAKLARGGPLEALHVLRIEVKKLRYAGEFFASLYDDERTRPVLKALRIAQDSLGRLNDLAVCDAVLARVEADAPKSRARTVARGAGKISGFLHAGHGDLRAEAEAAFADFAAQKPFWK
jgi:triphosphatase